MSGPKATASDAADDIVVAWLFCVSCTQFAETRPLVAIVGSEGRDAR